MGTSSSLLNRHEQDEDGTFNEDDETSVMQHIPIEVQPRKRLGKAQTNHQFSFPPLGGSFTKRAKGASFRSMVSVDFENNELERLRREFEMFRLSKQNEMGDIDKKVHKCDSENKRLRAELQALQKMCSKLRLERDAALESEYQALERATAFEIDRDKIKRQFKIFRETKDIELRELIETNQSLEQKLVEATKGSYKPKNSQQLSPKIYKGNEIDCDWWAMANEKNETEQRSEPSFKRFISTDSRSYCGPITVSRADWEKRKSIDASNLLNDRMLNVVHLVVHVDDTTLNDPREIACLEENVLWNLHLQMLAEGLVLHYRTVSSFESCKDLIQTWAHQILFLVNRHISGDTVKFLGETFVNLVSKLRGLFCFKGLSDGVKVDQVSRLKSIIQPLVEADNSRIVLIENYTDAVSMSAMVIEVLMDFAHKDFPNYLEFEDLFDRCACNRDFSQEHFQREVLNYYSSQELFGFDSYMREMSAHMLASGPVPPLLIRGPRGCGKSSLLATWLHQFQSSSPNVFLCHHFVEPVPSCRDSLAVIRRFTHQILSLNKGNHFLFPQTAKLFEIFPRVLEQSSKESSIILIAIDGADCLTNAASVLDWIRDPLPNDVRVVLTLTESSIPSVWDGLPSMYIDTSKNINKFISSISSNHSYCEKLSQFSSYLEVTCACILLEKYPDAEFQQGLVHGLLNHLVLKFSVNNELIKNVFAMLVMSYSGTMLLNISMFLNVPTNLINAIIDEMIILNFVGERRGRFFFLHSMFVESVIKLISRSEYRKIQEKYSSFWIDKLEDSSVHISLDQLINVLYLLQQLDFCEEVRSVLLKISNFQHLFSYSSLHLFVAFWESIGVPNEKIAEVYESSFSKSSEDFELVANVYEKLGVLYRELSLFEKSTHLLQRSLELRELYLDPDDSAVGMSLFQLGFLHVQWDKLHTAETLLKQAIEIQEAHNCSTDMARTYQLLILLYKRLGRVKQSETLKLKLRSIKKSTFSNKISAVSDTIITNANDSNHSPEKAKSLNDLGVLYYLQGKFDLAESMFNLALEMQIEIWGKDHEECSQTLYNLAGVYTDTERHDLAQNAYERCVDIRKKELPIGHNSTIVAMQHLAKCYKKQNNLSSLEVVYSELISMYSKTVGNEHPIIAAAYIDLAILYCQMKRFQAAWPLYEKALSIYENALGSQHERVAETLINMALFKFEQNDFENAALLYKRATSIHEFSSRNVDDPPLPAGFYNALPSLA